MSFGISLRNVQSGRDFGYHVIRASDLIPKTATFGCLTASDNQTSTLIKINQGEEDVPLDRNRITSINVSNLPTRKAEVIFNQN